MTHSAPPLDEQDKQLSTIVEPAEDSEAQELSVTREASIARHEIETALMVARRFPRDEERALNTLLAACKRLSFAERTIYSYPRGNTIIQGPSVHLAREAARVFGNIDYGFRIVRDDGKAMTVRGFAFDKETNTRVESDAHFRKLVYRKKGGWQTPDERDLRELVNKHGAIVERNCILKIVPDYFKEEAMAASREAQRAHVGKDTVVIVRDLLASFLTLHVTEADLHKFLKHPVSRINGEELVQLRGIYRSIADGNSDWSDYADPDAEKPAGAPNAAQGGTMDDLVGKATPATPEAAQKLPDMPQAAVDSMVAEPTPEEFQASAHHTDDKSTEGGALDVATPPAVETITHSYDPEAAKTPEPIKHEPAKAVARDWDKMLTDFREQVKRSSVLVRIKGMRDAIPSDCPVDYRQLMEVMADRKIDELKSGGSQGTLEGAS